MTTIIHTAVKIQISAQSVPSLPAWFGELTLLAHHLTQQHTLERIKEQVRFARRRFGQYDVIDFVAVLFGYAISGERTLESFYEHVQPWAHPFMALFGRDRLPARSTLSRFLAALDQAMVQSVRTLFLHDLLARPLVPASHPGGLWDRQGNHFLVFDLDGTREAARQRALPMTEDRPAPVRRLRPVCAPGYTGRKCGEVVRTRTTVLQAHTHQWLATLGHAGNGEYRAELRQAVAAIQTYLQAYSHQEARALLRLDGQYGTGAVLADVAGLVYVVRGKDYQVLQRPEVQARLRLPPDQQFTHPESGLYRSLYDCPDLVLGSITCRLIIATHPATETKTPIGVTREGIVYEVFFT